MSASQKLKHYLRRKDKANIKQVSIAFCDIKTYIYIYTYAKTVTLKNVYSAVSNLQTNYRLNYISKKSTNIQEASGQSTTPNTTRTISCKARNSPVDYPSWEYKFDMEGSDGNVFNPIFFKKVLGRNIPGDEEL